MSRYLFFPMVHFAGVAGLGRLAADAKADCDAIIERSVAAATAHHKRVFVEFGSSWCGPCRDLKKFLFSAPFQNAMGRYYDVVSVDYGEDFIRKANPRFYEKHKALDVPGAKAWLKSHGLNENMPELAILDEQGKAVVCYERPYRGAQSWERLYFPTERDEDLTVALKFFADGNPAVTSKDLVKLRDAFVRDRKRRH